MSAIIFDIETVADYCAADYVPAPDLDAITAAGNLKDPEKIAADIEKRKAAAMADHRAALSRAALDWNLSRIVAIGWHLSGQREPECVLINNGETDEAGALKLFWTLAQNRKLVGFAARSFDVPTLIQRSRLLGVSHPHISLAKFGRGDVTDVREILTFDDARYEAIMPRSLKAFAKRFGIPDLDPTTGKDVAQMVAEGDWEGVRAHCLSDIDLTRELALRIGCLPTWKRVAA